MNAEAEFTSLRQELLESETHIVNISIFVMTVSGASLTAAFQFRNPLVALFPLLVLYLGYVIVFNNVQTIALIGSYIRVFWEEEHQEFHWETRQAKRRKNTEKEGTKSRRREVWMGPLAKQMFFATGILCIFIFAYISGIVLFAPQGTVILLPLPPIWNLGIFLYIFLISLGVWLLKWWHSSSLTNVYQGENSMMDEFSAAWEQVKKKKSGPENKVSRKLTRRVTKTQKRPL